jgi:hypothetical protein
MRERSDLWRRLESMWLDPAIVGMLLLLPALGGLFGSYTDYVVDVLLIVPLLLRRRAPVVAFTTVSLLLMGQAVLLDDVRYGDVALLFGLYAIAAYGPRWAAWAGLATGLLGTVVATTRWYLSPDDPAGTVAVFVALGTVVFASWLLGYLARTRRAYVARPAPRSSSATRRSRRKSRRPPSGPASPARCTTSSRTVSRSWSCRPTVPCTPLGSDPSWRWRRYARSRRPDARR